MHGKLFDSLQRSFILLPWTRQARELSRHRRVSSPQCRADRRASLAPTRVISPRSRRPPLAGTPSPPACLNRRRCTPWSAPTCATCSSHLCRTGRLFEPTCSTAGPQTLGAAVCQTLSSPRANGRYALRKGGRVIAPQPGPALPSQQEPADWRSLGIAPDSQ